MTDNLNSINSGRDSEHSSRRMPAWAMSLSAIALAFALVGCGGGDGGGGQTIQPPPIQPTATPLPGPPTVTANQSANRVFPLSIVQLAIQTSTPGGLQQIQVSYEGFLVGGTSFINLSAADCSVGALQCSAIYSFPPFGPIGDVRWTVEVTDQLGRTVTTNDTFKVAIL